MEYLPHQMVEAMIVTGYAIEARQAYIFLRSEYVEAAERLRQAIKQAEQELPGENILAVAGGICMFIPAQAVISAAKKRHSSTRSKGVAPIPQQAALSADGGIVGPPTIVNNVETLCNIPYTSCSAGQNGFANCPSAIQGGTKLLWRIRTRQKPGLWNCRWV